MGSGSVVAFIDALPWMWIHLHEGKLFETAWLSARKTAADGDERPGI